MVLGGGREAASSPSQMFRGKVDRLRRESRNLAQESRGDGGSRTFMQYECERRRRHLPSPSVSRGIKESGGIDGAGGGGRRRGTSEELQKASLMTRTNSAVIICSGARCRPRGRRSCRSFSSSHLISHGCCDVAVVPHLGRERKKNACPTIRSSVPDSHASFHARSLPAAPLCSCVVASQMCSTAANDLCVFGLRFYQEHETNPLATQKSNVVTTTFAKLKIAKKKRGTERWERL